MRLLEIPFRFGRAAGDILDSSAHEFYLASAKHVFRETIDDAVPFPLHSVPLGFDMILDAGLVFKAVDRRLSDPDWDGAIIDLARPPEFVLTTHHVVAGIARAIFADIKRNRDHRFVLLIPTMLPQDDVVMIALQPLIQAGTLSILADTGDAAGIPFFTADDAQAHHERVLKFNPPVMSLFKKKLIRFPGHFNAGMGIENCTDVYFDGKLCLRELVDLIDEFVHWRYPHSAARQILYNSVISPWCEAAVLAYCERKGGNSWNMAESSTERSYFGLSQVLLVLPLLGSGQTARELVTRIREASPAVDLTVLAILSTQGDEPLEGSPGLLPASEATAHVPVFYFLRVARRQWQQNACVLCQAGMSKSDPLHPDPYITLTSQAFWTLAEIVGFEDERDVPPYRTAIGRVPRFRAIDFESGAFLAYKIERLLRSTGNLPVDPVVICPFEEGAAAIADCLETVFNMTVIRVPKPALEAEVTPAPSTTISQLSVAALPRWEIQVRSLIEYRETVRARGAVFGHQNENVILLDELSVTGRTRDRLLQFAANWGLDVRCCLTVVDFNATAQEGLVLYRIDLPQTPSVPS
jgi:hypothetical protein